ncbi:MAG: hypothetical protein HY735_31440 [Verrucomicrobia bacterium]|nr:hypothetical protein [Verrucomicrobiota bacterium]
MAVAIAAGMLAVVLFFYTQAANLRVHLFYESSRISAARLLLDRLTKELSNARRCDSYQTGLSGGPEQIEFVRLDPPASSSWTNSPEPALTAPPSPFRVIRYATLRPSEGTNGVSNAATNVLGITRSEEPLMRRTLELPEEDELSVTNAVPARRSPVSIDQFQFIRFRYFDGAAWLDSWPGPGLPWGVEVSLGAEPLPDDSLADDYPYEVFRRVIYLPGHQIGTARAGLDVLPDPFPGSERGEIDATASDKSDGFK